MHRILLLVILMGQCTSSACQARVYHFVDQRKNWSEAQSYCREKHTDLATINGMEDIQLLKDSVDGVNEPGPEAWIGLEKTGERRWYWPKLDIELNETEAMWNQGEPNDIGGIENCVVMQHDTGNWADVGCNQKYYFICQNETEFKLIKLRRNWTSAQSYCKTNHRHLASPKDNAENLEVYEVLKDMREHATIGLISDPWKWSDCSNSSFKNFKENPGQSGNCTVTNLADEGKWNARKCSETLPFFCYSELGCLDGWKKFNSSCYRQFTHRSVNQSAAQQHCQDLNAHLVSIHSQEEQRFVNCINSLDKQWIGLNDRNNKWTDGSSLVYTNWDEQQPNVNPEKEDCVMIRGDKWHDVSCDKSISGFTCKSVLDNLILIKKNMTWFNAVDYCRKEHHDLVSVHNISEQEQVRQRAKMADTHHVWLGMHYSCPFDFWFWLSNSCSCYRNWAPGNGTGSCGMAAAVKRGGNQSWVSLDHDNEFNFICVRK